MRACSAQYRMKPPRFLAERRRPEGPRERQRHAAVLLVGHAPAAVGREPVLVRFPQRHPGQGIPALADQAAGHVPVAGAGVAAWCRRSRTTQTPARAMAQKTMPE